MTVCLESGSGLTMSFVAQQYCMGGDGMVRVQRWTEREHDVPGKMHTNERTSDSTQ